MTFDLSARKTCVKIHVMWAIFMPILSFQELFTVELGVSLRQLDGQTMELNTLGASII